MTLHKPTDPLEARIYNLLLPFRSATPQNKEVEDLDFSSLYRNLALLIRCQSSKYGLRSRPEDISAVKHRVFVGLPLVTQLGPFIHGPGRTWSIVKVKVQDGGDWLQALLLTMDDVVKAAFCEIGD